MQDENEIYRRTLAEANTHTADIAQNFLSVLKPEDVGLVLLACACKVLEPHGREELVTTLLGFAAEYDERAGKSETES